MKTSKWLIMSLVCAWGLHAPVFGITYTWWGSDRSVGSNSWSDVGNWSAGFPDLDARANFAVTQANTYEVNVDTNAVLKKILVSYDYVFNGSGSIELQPNSEEHWDPACEGQPDANCIFNVPVTIAGTSDYVMDVRNWGMLTFNGALTLTNTTYNRPVNFNATGTTIINGDLYNYCGIRMGSSGTVRIGGSGTTVGTGPLTLGSGRVELNRSNALLNTAITLTGSILSLGAEDAIGNATDITLNGGGLEDQGYNQDFGWMDVGNSTVTIDMGSSDSVWTFADSSSQGWGTGPVAIKNTGDSVIRFDLGSGTGLTESQLGKISVEGTTLSTANTTVSNGYLYIVRTIPATGDTWWGSGRPAGATWGTSLNWSAGRPSLAGRANFVSAQTTTYDVDVDIDALLKKMLISTNYVFNGTGSIELQPASTAHWDKAIEVNQTEAVSEFNVDVKVVGTTDYVLDIRNYGLLTFNGSLTLTNTTYDRPINFNATGTTIINGDFYNYCGIRMGSSGTVRIGGSGTTVGTGPLTLGSGRVELNRAGALLNGAVTLTGATMSFGADGAIGAAANMTLNGGGLEAEGGYAQNFGWLDIGDSGISFDMGSSTSVWTFADSSSQSWGSGTLAISNVDGVTIRFDLGSGTGLTETQIGQITINGSTLLSSQTSVEDGYLYIVKRVITPQERYDAWAGTYGLSAPQSDLLADPDADGTGNLLEYALGGNPTNSDVSAALSVVSEGGTTRLEYVYLRRLDAVNLGLTYEALHDDSLLAGAWTNTGISETSGPFNAEFETVTNSISMETEDMQFLKLSVEFASE